MLSELSRIGREREFSMNDESSEEDEQDACQDSNRLIQSCQDSDKEAQESNTTKTSASGSEGDAPPWIIITLALIAEHAKEFQIKYTCARMLDFGYIKESIL